MEQQTPFSTRAPQPTQPVPAPGPVELDPALFAQVAGGSPRGTWQAMLGLDVRMSPRGTW